jgi:hypothetical protein
MSRCDLCFVREIRATTIRHRNGTHVYVYHCLQCHPDGSGEDEEQTSAA